MNEQIGNKINDKTYIKLTPFKGFVLENFPFIEADFDAITNYQLLCKIIEYLNNVISNQNTVQELGTDLVNAYNSLVDAVNLAINEFETDVTTDINQFKVDINNDFDEFTSNITTQFNNLKNYVDNYFDNNFPELVSDKLDEMAENGTLQSLLLNYSHLEKIYNNIEEMISDETIVSGMTVKTLGYYNVNDGGHGEYTIVNDETLVDDGGLIHVLNNGLRAKLILNDFISPEIFGAKGDGITDDYNAINNCIEKSISNSFYIIGRKEYLIGTTLNIDSNTNLKINKLIYNGQNQAIFINGSNNIIEIKKIISNGIGIRLSPTLEQLCSNNIIDVNFIEANNNGIELIANDWGILDNIIKFNNIKSKTNHYSIYCYAEHNPLSSNVTYVGENAFYGGRVEGGSYGIYAKSIGDSPVVNCEITGLKFYNVSLEGSEKGLYFDNINFSVVDYPRYQELEASSDVIFELVNNTRSCIFNCTSPISLTNIIYENLTNSEYVANELNCPTRKLYGGSIIGKNARLSRKGLGLIPIYNTFQTTSSNTLIDLTNDPNIPTYFRLISTSDTTLKLSEFYKFSGISEFYVYKASTTSKIDITDKDNNILYTLNNNQSGFFHFTFNQEGYLLVIGN